MVVVHFNMQGEDIFDCTNGMCHVFTFEYEEEDILEHVDGKCQSCTL